MSHVRRTHKTQQEQEHHTDVRGRHRTAAAAAAGGDDDEGWKLCSSKSLIIDEPSMKYIGADSGRRLRRQKALFEHNDEPSIKYIGARSGW
jgi:hypothetical protein